MVVVFSHSVVSDSSVTPWTVAAPRLLYPLDSPGKNTGADGRFLLQEIFLTQGSNLGLLYCKQIPNHCATREWWKDIVWLYFDCLMLPW